MKCMAYILLVLLTVSPALSGDLYRWVDKDGTVNYSDSPPPSSSKATATRRHHMTPADPFIAEYTGHRSAKVTDPTQKVHPEIAEMDVAARAQQRRHDKMMLQLQLKLLEAQGQPADSLEAYKLKMAFAENLRRQAREREGAEAITILEEAKQMYMEMTNAVIEYK